MISKQHQSVYFGGFHTTSVIFPSMMRLFESIAAIRPRALHSEYGAQTNGILGAMTTSACSPASMNLGFSILALPVFTPTIHVRTAKAPCQIRSIKWKIGKKTGNAKMENPKFIEAGEQAEVVMAPRMPFVCAAYDECKALGRMAAMDSNTLIMLGKITAVKYKDAK